MPSEIPQKHGPHAFAGGPGSDNEDEDEDLFEMDEVRMGLPTFSVLEISASGIKARPAS